MNTTSIGLIKRQHPWQAIAFLDESTRFKSLILSMLFLFAIMAECKVATCDLNTINRMLDLKFTKEEMLRLCGGGDQVQSPAPNNVDPTNASERIPKIDWGELTKLFSISNVRSERGGIGFEVKIQTRQPPSAVDGRNTRVGAAGTGFRLGSTIFLTGGGVVVDKDNLRCGGADIQIDWKYDSSLWQVGMPGQGYIRLPPGCRAESISFRYKFDFE